MIKRKRRLLETFSQHMEDNKRSREEKETNVKNATTKNTIVACYDLQAVLQAPCGEISVFYYKRKLNCFNFTIYDVVKKQCYCYFWTEAMASRGANEVALFIPMFLENQCSGQNKNKAILLMYLMLNR